MYFPRLGAPRSFATSRPRVLGFAVAHGAWFSGPTSPEERNRANQEDTQPTDLAQVPGHVAGDGHAVGAIVDVAPPEST